MGQKPTPRKPQAPTAAIIAYMKAGEEREQGKDPQIEKRKERVQGTRCLTISAGLE